MIIIINKWKKELAVARCRWSTWLSSSSLLQYGQLSTQKKVHLQSRAFNKITSFSYNHTIILIVILKEMIALLILNLFSFCYNTVIKTIIIKRVWFTRIDHLLNWPYYFFNTTTKVCNFYDPLNIAMHSIFSLKFLYYLINLEAENWCNEFFFKNI